MAPTAENFRVFFAAFNDRQRAIETGTVLRERVAEIEQLATAVFERERIDRTRGNNRYAQIIREYEDPQVGQWPSARRHKYRELNGYEALAKDQISTALYCAARVLSAVSSIRATLQPPESPNPYHLAIEAMRLEQAAWHLVYAEQYAKRHSTERAQHARQTRAQKAILALRAQHKKKPIVHADYAALRARYGVSQKTLRRWLVSAGAARPKKRTHRS
jgi:hypothetical protein